jgi:hypothetical protein
MKLRLHCRSEIFCNDDGNEKAVVRFVPCRDRLGSFHRVAAQ